jgi:signal transduction histidine kinase
MTLRTRFVVFGAVLPVVALLLAAFVAGWVFRREQLADLDRRLLAQAAVESVGLFDGPGGAPHVHVPDSPIAEVVRDFAPDSGVFDARGALVSRAPDRSRLPASVPLRGELAQVRLATSSIAGRERRVLELPVRAPDGSTYTLWLGASFAPVDATMAGFYRATIGAVIALALALLGLQLVIAKRLTRRIDAVTTFLPYLREGDPSIPADPIRDELGTLRDTLREVAVRLADARAEQDRLLASAAHELRTPLTVMRTEIDLALRRERPPEELREALRSARDEVVRLAELATALLDLQAVRHLGFAHKPGDVAALVREACAGFGAVAETSGIEFRIAAAGPAPARFDERALRQAIDNLLANALRYAPSGTAIEVEVTRAGMGWQVAVADRGPGIPSAEAERVFEPFHRLADAPAGTGSGLGLAIVREVASRHGGNVVVDPTHAPGARIVLQIAES